MEEQGDNTLTESCDTITTEPSIVDSVDSFGLEPDEIDYLQSIRQRIIIRQFLRMWLQNFRQRHGQNNI